MDSKEFKHDIKETVKFHEVDMLGVCNNAVYFNYFEDERIKYVQDLVKKFNLKDKLPSAQHSVLQLLPPLVVCAADDNQF